MSLWQSLNGGAHITTLNLKLYRVVENQEEVATTLITSNKEEQAILEDLLEHSKPAQTLDLSKRHYLIKTPFRYPPLSHGSRFGKISEPGLFYGSTDATTALAEVAYYRFLFLADIEDASALTLHKLQSSHSLFYVQAHSEKSIGLIAPPFAAHQEAISATADYHTSQQLGSAMRDAGIEVFNFYSARVPEKVNGGVFAHRAIKSRSPRSIEHWQCLTQQHRVVFHQVENKKLVEFGLAQFCKDGILPRV